MMEATIELTDLPALAAEILDEIEAGAEPVTIMQDGEAIATITGVPPGDRGRAAVCG